MTKLRILGFKSFADEIELEFQPGLTAIVGPNGCGKSNISDAIRWVLGEQNARFLRGKEMGDVIFNGTASRKPLGMAEINLEMSNLGSLPLNYKQIQITRKLYRSGESEYLFNKKTCRLKDITDLFLEWGMNKRAYTTVEQGNIDFIINAKPQERRILVETAAGILKYKERKREAVQKMELTKGNLDRIQDIKNEVENQRKSLQRQARQARLYKTLCQQTEEKENRCLIMRYKIIMFHLRQTESDYRKLSDKEQGILAQLRSREAEQEKSHLESLRLGSDFERLQKELWEKEAEKRQMEKGLESLIQEKTLREETLVRLTREKELLNEKQKRSKEAFEELNSELAKLESDLLTGENKKKDMEEEKARSQSQLNTINDQLEKKKRDLSVFNTSISLARNNLSHLKAKEASIKKNISEGIDSEKELSREEENIRYEITSIGKKTEDVLTRMKAMEEIRQKHEEEYNRLSELLKDQVVKIEKERELSAGLRHKKAHLEELERKMEGFRSAVRHLLQRPSTKKTIAHFLSIERQYEPALEAVLGDDIQDILIESRDEALEMIDELRSSKKGKATFVPISMAREEDNAQIVAEIKAHPGFIGRLIDLARFEADYRKIFFWFLGDFLVVDDLKTALNLEGKYGDRWSFVTLEGDIIRSGGILIGGGTETGPAGILSRKRELKELAEKITLEETRLNGLLREQDSLKKERIDIDQELSGIREEIAGNESMIKDLNRDRKYFDKEKEILEKRKTKIVQARIQSEKDLINVRQSVLKEQEEERKIIEDLDSLKKEIQTLEEKRKIAQKIRDTINQTYMEEGMTLVSRRERILALNREKKGYEDTYTEREMDLVKTGEEIEGINKRISAIEQEICQVDESLPGFRNNVIKYQQDLEGIRNLFNRAKGKVMEDEDDLRSIRHDLEQIRKQLKSKEIEVAEWKTRLDDLQQDFSFIPEDVTSQDDIVKFESELGDLKVQLERLKERTQNFGSVNLGAIEAFEEVNERYQFLNNQISDLQKALESLRSIIREINSTSRELFHGAFYKIKEDFQQIFARLFNGGQAELHLEEGMDCLEAGIHIIAQPPGKRLQRIDLLSGGEKALTALALILAVYQLKPSPFCILDEVDAPLDETNVDRFLRLIKEMKEKTQFIIITHCKRTMMNVDSIYGITMETPGVSKIVSVRMDQAEDFYADTIPGKREYLGAVQ
ncbi:MAG: chromosome segregation protein SMC [bacterium]